MHTFNTAQQLRLLRSKAWEHGQSLRPINNHLFEVLAPITVYKRVMEDNSGSCKFLFRTIQLELPPGAVVRLSNNGEAKCRANMAWVLPNKHKKKLVSGYWEDFLYKPNTFVFPVTVTDYNYSTHKETSMCFDPADVECTSGIHFFFKKEDADAWR